MNRSIIMIAGYAGSGKDTISNFFVSNRHFVRVAFADSLKEFCAAKYGIDIKKFHTQEGKSSIYEKNENMTLRDILIEEASNQRKTDPNFFVNLAIDKIKRLNHDIVISDFRYLNEYYNIKREFRNNFKIKTLRVDRPGVTIADELSEHQLDEFNFDHKVTNSSTIGALRAKLDDMEI